MNGPSVNALRVKHPRGVASLPDPPRTPAGRILGVALLADTLPGSVGLDAPTERVTASLAVRWAVPPDHHDAGPVLATLRRLRGYAPYLPVDGRIRTADGRPVASTLALFARVPPQDLPPGEHAGRLSADVVGAALLAAVDRALATGAPVGLDPAWANRRGILHGAVGSATLAIAACRALMVGGAASRPAGPAAVGPGPLGAAWPRIADGHVRFLRPVDAVALSLEVDVLRRSERSADVDVRAIVDRRPAILGRYLLAVPAEPSVR